MAEPDSKEAGGGSAAGEDISAGINVLVVDDDPVCLMVLRVMLRKYHYNVMECREAKKALEILREKKEYFDLVISDVQMPDMDGLKLLEHMGIELDLPVIMVSANLSAETVKKGIIHGACDFIPKPITMKSLQCIYQHVLRRKMMINNDDHNNNNSNNNNNDSNNTNDDNENKNESASRSVKKRKEVSGEDESKKSNVKKAKRFNWTGDIHKLFLEAIDRLGGSNGAVPKKILSIMNVEGLTREHVASHLQKHRQGIRKSENAQQALLHKNQTSTNQHLITQPIINPHLNLLNTSALLANPINGPGLLANSISTPGLLANPNMSMQLYSRQQQQQMNNILINNYQSDLRSLQQFGNNTNNGYGISTPSVFYFNKDGNISSNGNGLMGMNKAGLMPTGYAVDGLVSSNSNLTYSNNCSETPNNVEWYNGLI